MKRIFKFKNGDRVTVPIADHNSKYWYVIVNLRTIKEKDIPIIFDMGNGETYESSGKELDSVELKFK